MESNLWKIKCNSYSLWRFCRKNSILWLSHTRHREQSSTRSSLPPEDQKINFFHTQNECHISCIRQITCDLYFSTSMSHGFNIFASPFKTQRCQQPKSPEGISKLCTMYVASLITGMYLPAQCFSILANPSPTRPWQFVLYNPFKENFQVEVLGHFQVHDLLDKRGRHTHTSVKFF